MFYSVLVVVQQTVPDAMHVVPVNLRNLMTLRIALKLKFIFIAVQFIEGCSCGLGSGPACSSEDVCSCRGLSLAVGFGSIGAFGQSVLATKTLVPFTHNV